MLLYLSSYKLGNKTDELKKWIKENNNKILVIPNALDALEDNDIKKEKILDRCKELESLGFEYKILDLRKYFGKKTEMLRDIQDYHAFYTLGGNVFVLRTAMKLSGFDEYLIKISKKTNYLYSGYSAGICVLTSKLNGSEKVDDCSQDPYDYGNIIWDGIGLINYFPVPHFDTPEHPESHLIYVLVEYLTKNNTPYKTLKDGDVIIENI